MAKSIRITILIVLALIIGSMAYLLTTDSVPEAKQETVDKNVSTQAPVDTSTAPPNGQAMPGTYTDYTETIITDTSGTKLLFFHAPWCPQCRALEADIKRVGVPDGVTIIKVDYDSNQSLRQKYGVTIQTTIVRVDDSGELVRKYVAYDSPTLDSVVKNVL